MNQLPVEVCEEIFKNLDQRGVLSARRTCRRWRQIVDGSPALMSRIHLKPPLLVMDRNCTPICSIPARRITLRNVNVLSVGSWWESIGQELTFLMLENCVISTETVVSMLRKTPNLRFLSYICQSYVAEVETNFHLDKLEHLEVYSAQTKTLDIFGEICPRLKHFRFGQQNDARKLGEFLQKVRETLETLQLISVESILHDVLGLKKLTRLHIQSDTFRNEALGRIGAALPNLSHLRVTLQWQPSTLTPTFLYSMPKLKSLTMFGQYRLNSPSITIGLGNLVGHHRLEKLHLTRFKPLKLKEFLQQCDQFIDLTLHYCEFNNWSDIFTVIGSLEALKRLDLGKLRIPADDIIVFEYLDNLKYLKLTHCFFSKNTIKSFVEHCENLEEVNLSNLKYVLDDETVQSLCPSWKSLNKLTLASNLISDITIDHIIEHCRNLMAIDVSECTKVSKKAVEKLTNQGIEVKHEITYPKKYFSDDYIAEMPFYQIW